MSGPTIEARLQRRFIVMSPDAALREELRAALPEGWECAEPLELDELGGFDAILLYRFLLLDLDGNETFDPLGVIRKVRMELMLNLPIICVGGHSEVRDQARLNRADRFFERPEAAKVMRLFCDQCNWG